MTDLFQYENDTLKAFLDIEFLTAQDAKSFAMNKGWADVDDQEDWETFSPNGKLAFQEYLPWYTDQDVFFAAAWANFVVPGKHSPMGTMNLNEAWLEGGETEYWFEFACVLLDKDPMGKRDTNGYDEWFWAIHPEDKGWSNTNILRLIPLGDNVFKFSRIITHLVKDRKDR